MSGHEDSYVDYYDDSYDDSYDDDYEGNYSYKDNSYSDSGGGSSPFWFSWFRQSTVQSSQSDYSDRIEEVRLQAEREYQQQLRPLEKRQQQFESSLNNLSSNIGQVEREMVQRDGLTQKRLQQQGNDFTKQLRQQRNDNQCQLQHQRQEYRRLIDEQGQHITNLVEEECRHRVKAVNNLQQQIKQITADASRKQEIATSFVADLTKILNETSKLPHERFAPGQLDLVQRHIRDAGSNVNAGIPEAALSTAQEAYWKLADLRSLVLQKEAEFMMLHQAALEEVRTILEEARLHRHCKVNPEGAEVGDSLEFEVDYWTCGELKAFEKDFQEIERKLVSQEKSLSTENLKEIIISMEDAEAKLIQIIKKARDGVIASQLRLNTAEMVVNALAPQGFDVDAGLYEGNDQRNAYVAKVRNRAGTEIVTVISPVPDNNGRCRVSIHSYDVTYVSAETLRDRAREVASLLEKEGLKVASPKCMGDADQSYRDLSVVAARQTEVIQRRTEQSSH